DGKQLRRDETRRRERLAIEARHAQLGRLLERDDGERKLEGDEQRREETDARVLEPIEVSEPSRERKSARTRERAQEENREPLDEPGEQAVATPQIAAGGSDQEIELFGDPIAELSRRGHEPLLVFGAEERLGERGDGLPARGAQEASPPIAAVSRSPRCHVMVSRWVGSKLQAAATRAAAAGAQAPRRCRKRACFASLSPWLLLRRESGAISFLV